MKWQFEEFEAGPVVQSSARIHVTINPRGNFYLNGRALKALDEPDAVVLFYDRRLQTIGMKRAPLTKENAFPLRPKDGTRTAGRTIYAANFLRHHHIKLQRTVAFVNATVDDGHLILSMREVAPVERK